MKAARDLLILVVTFLLGALCLNGYVHNLYLMAASDVSLMTIFRAIGAILFPLGILLGLI
jgi:general stress protein CsbA